ncbi:hypothetical protein O181_057098 [Austropuccinia psidii MF-1]|uniref:Uncharacterized protein n=1 Tax=Austropuccinia psidii MF-1 TaxID=1389203 RepID=A0A9Q3EAQ0_9BASI|nr:hypothetical protein [Austropuccinia psidii MF-1]
MSREDQVNPISYAFISICSNFSFQESIPLKSLCPIRLNRLNRRLPYLGAQELTIEGRGVLSQPQVMNLLHGCCHNPAWNQVGANWPHHISYSQFAPFGHINFPWPFMASGHILPSLASVANFHISNPQVSIFAFGLGGVALPPRGFWAPYPEPPLFIRGSRA